MSEPVVLCPEPLLPGDGSEELLAEWARRPGVDAVVGLPDLHWKTRNSAPTGAVLISHDRLFPAFLDTGSGCGMALIALSGGAISDAATLGGDMLVAASAPPRAIAREELARILGRDADALALFPRPVVDRACRSLGRLGGGNHFAELHELVEIADADAARRAGLAEGVLILLVHAGSGRAGRTLGRLYGAPWNSARAAFYHLRHHPWLLFSWWRPGGLRADSTAGRQWLSVMAALDRLGAANRREIAERLMKVVQQRTAATVAWSVDLPHNHVAREEWDGRAAYVHRHGAAVVEGGLLPLPGGPCEDLWLVELGPAARAWRACNHGTGRGNDHAGGAEREPGVLLCGPGRERAEVLSARYKPLLQVLEAMEAAGLARRVARCRPRVALKLA